jgi:hypothetical protein
MVRTRNSLPALAAVLSLGSAPAQAHWCDDLWISSYNIVVRPESDTLAVPATGTASLGVFVQNNMGYQLPNFVLAARIGATTLTTLSATRQGQTVANMLLPGEKARYVLAVAKPGGGDVKTEDITFSVSFGNPGEDQGRCYPTKGANAVMLVKTDGTLYPAPPLPGLDHPQTPPGCIFDLPQGLSLQYEAMADFEDVDRGLDSLLQLYCAGRGSWNVGAGGVRPSNCPDTSRTTCPSNRPAAGTGEKYAYARLWAAGDLAARKSALGPRLPVLRARLQCGVNDGDLGFAGYALFMLGYLGEDAAARAFIRSLTDAGGDLGLIAKAALHVMGNRADPTDYQAEVTAGVRTSNFFARMACAGALGIADKDDATVRSVLLPGLTWTRPDGPDNGKGMYAAHLLALVAWDRRGWAANGADTGAISFYGGPEISLASPGAGLRPSGGSKSCSCDLGGRGRVSGLALLSAAVLGLLLRTRQRPRRHSPSRGSSGIMRASTDCLRRHLLGTRRRQTWSSPTQLALFTDDARVPLPIDKREEQTHNRSGGPYSVGRQFE